jgi:formylglycine-generating enzyme required for sulfatase activity
MRSKQRVVAALAALIFVGMSTTALLAAAPPKPPPQVQAEAAQEAWRIATTKAPVPEVLEKLVQDAWAKTKAARDAAKAAMQAKDYPRAEAQYKQAARLLASIVPTIIPEGWTVSTRSVSILTPKGPAKKNISYYMNSTGMEFVRVEAREFVMGSVGTRTEAIARGARGYHTPIDFLDGFPMHKVQITQPFYMGATEVTQAQFKAIMNQNPSRFKGDDRPVDTVGWASCQQFRRALSRRDGVTYRLPTEAEWEYACRAGTTTAFYTGATITAKQATFSARQTTPVASYPANPWGLYDMTGNLLEWCQDWYHCRFYEECPLEDPFRATIGHDRIGNSYARRRVLRGGCWLHPVHALRSGQRHRNGPSGKFSVNGFRVVATIREVRENVLPDLLPDDLENQFPAPPAP